MFARSSCSLCFFSAICWLRKTLIFSWSDLILSTRFYSMFLWYTSLSFSYLASISSSHCYFWFILVKTLSAILFMNSWALASLDFISFLRSHSYLSSILEYSSWALRSSSLYLSSSSFILFLFCSFSRSIFWR